MCFKHKGYYIIKDNTMQFGWNEYGELFELQAMAYDYYYFYKLNYLMIDCFSNPCNYPDHLLQAIDNIVLFYLLLPP